MKAETSLDRKISTLREFIKRWREIMHTLVEVYNTPFYTRLDLALSKEQRNKLHENIHWCSSNYASVKDAESERGVISPSGTKATYPVIWNSLSKFQVLTRPDAEDLEYLKASYLSLLAKLGSLEKKKKSIGEIDVEEYEKFRSLIERLKLEYSMFDSLIELAESSEFLGLRSEWMLSAIALQLQEVVITLVAERLGVKLSKSNVSKILGKQFEKGVPFKDRYMAFCKEIKRTKDTTLPILPTELRGMRAKVLHKGLSPQANETKLLTDFTCSFLKDLNRIIE